MAIYYLWNVRYVGWLVSRSASDSGVGETSAPLSAVVVNGIKILLGQPVEGFTPSVIPVPHCDGRHGPPILDERRQAEHDRAGP